MPIRLLQIVNTLYPGGAEKLVIETSKAFVRKGLDVDILILKSLDIDRTEILKSEYDIEVFSLGENTNIYNPLCISGIKKILRKGNYDVVHVHLFPALYWAAYAVGGSSDTQLIYTEHNTHNKRREKLIFKWLDPYIYKKYDRIISISEKAHQNLLAYLGSESERFCTINNGVNLNAITDALPYSKAELGLPEDGKLIIQVSHFREQKNQKALIKALHKLNEKVHLFLVGDGPLMDENKELSRTLGIEERVHFLGLRDDVPRLLKTSDIVVLSSHHEGLSLSSVEGMASGSPFVASNVPGLREVVEGAGILFEDDDVEGLAEILQSLMKNQQLYESTVQNCLARSREYDIELMVQRYIDVYQKSIAAV